LLFKVLLVRLTEALLICGRGSEENQEGCPLKKGGDQNMYIINRAIKA
jgi:hypothetical protein